MPEIDGYEVCRRLKDDPATKDIPIMFVTAISEEEDEAKGLAMGAVDYVHKPYSLATIKARIATQLALKDQRDKLAHAQKQLQEANAQLEERVAVRTADLITTNEKLMEEVFEHKKTTEALEQAQVAAGQAKKAKRNFLDNMSHEIRTPINGIIGFTSLLAVSELPERQKAYVDMITASSERLLDTVDKVLDFAKIESENLQLAGRVFSVADLLKVIFSEVEEKAKKKGLIFRCNTNKEMQKKVVGDPHRLQQILTNLVENAIKFSHEGDGDIVIGAEVESYFNGGMTVHFMVQDHGAGIEKGKQDKIFRAFNQADTSNTRKYEGNGLGLTISSLLIQMMGGNIWVESKLGAGSTFHVTVNFDYASGETDRFAAWEASELIDPELEGRNEEVDALILLAEDEEVNQQLLQDLLEEQGWQVHAVSNGKEAVDAYREGGYDLILMDIQMPEMTGHEATSVIRFLEKQSGEHIPIIAVTAHAMEGDRQKCLDMGMDDYVAKPVKTSLLFQAIRRHLAKRNSAD